jgi:hypothetical protein
MKYLLMILIASMFCACANAGNILNEHMEVFISEPVYDTSGGTIHEPMVIWGYDKLSGQNFQIGTIDLHEFDIEYTLGMYLYATDWKRDRLIIAATRQVLKPNYLILDLNSMTISDLKSDTLENHYYGYLYIDPDCDYLLLMGADEKSSKSQYEDPNILYIYTFSADDYSFLAKINGIASLGISNPPAFFLPIGGKSLYLKNPFKSSWFNDIIKLSLPNLAISDTIKIPSFCGDSCVKTITYDIRANKAIIFSQNRFNDKLASKYKLINLDTHKEIASLSIDTHSWAILSDEANYTAIQDTNGIIDIYDTLFTKIYTIDDATKEALRYGYFHDSILLVGSEHEDGIMLKYDINQRKFIEKISTEEHY